MTEYFHALSALSALGLLEHEALAAVESAADAASSRPLGKRTHQLISNDQPIGMVAFNAHGNITAIDIARDVWSRIDPIIQADTAVVRYGIAQSVVFASRPLSGYARASSWLQLRPVLCELKDSRSGQPFSRIDYAVVPSPVVTEVRYRRSGLLFLDGHRRFRSVQEAHWLLAAFIDVPIHGFSGDCAWAFLQGCYQLVTFGMGTGLETESDEDFSSTTGLQELMPVPEDQYYTQLGIGHPELRVPDLADLHARFSRLDPAKRARFLRACAALWSAFQPGLADSLRLISLVTAIEPLLETPDQCPACGSAVGITKAFRGFLASYVKPPPDVRDLYEAVYKSRSKVVHGGWNFEVDEPFMALSNNGYTTSVVAWGAAKRGVVNWLLAQ